MNLLILKSIYELITAINPTLSTDISAIIAHIPIVFEKNITFYNYLDIYHMSTTLIDNVKNATYLGGSTR